MVVAWEAIEDWRELMANKDTLAIGPGLGGAFTFYSDYESFTAPYSGEGGSSGCGCFNAL